jgi:anti-sigma regulatory factor (Ser/Thr protein kinase)
MPYSRWQVPAHVRYVPVLRRAAVDFYRRHCLTDETVEQGLALAVNEGCANAVRHAYPDGLGDLRFEVSQSQLTRSSSPSRTTASASMLHAMIRVADTG